MTQGGLRLSNTLSGEKEKFEASGGSVLMYVCGLTVSDDPHLGHARTWISFDVVHRYLEYLGYDVLHVENITDVDDKIINKAEEEGVDWRDIATRYSHQVFEDMRELNLRRVEVRPRVTEHITDIQELVRELISAGYAYEGSDGVYFDVDEFEGYGELSGQVLSELEGQGEEAEGKKDPRDFALWKLSEEEPAWESPWGLGRPGWHIECSAMSTRHLGDTIDIHGGGRDLVFPHHENEIAQAEAATGKEFARYWMHVGPLRVEGDKMSTSLDNFWTVHEALREYSANEIRAFLISTQYLKPQSFTEDALEEGRDRYTRLENAVKVCEDSMDSMVAKSKEIDEELREAVMESRSSFEEAMNDDFNTPEALAALHNLANKVNLHTESEEYDYHGLFQAWNTFHELGGGVLGFDFSGGAEEPLTNDLVELVLEVREHEREQGNYEFADEIRSRLHELGVIVEDSEDGSVYRYN